MNITTQITLTDLEASYLAGLLDSDIQRLASVGRHDEAARVKRLRDDLWQQMTRNRTEKAA